MKDEPVEEVLVRIRDWRKAGLKVVFTNGVFDILHRGHLDSLEYAASLGDKLVVGVNSNSSARRLGKGKGRPFNQADDRAALLESIRYVDAVVIFEEDTPKELIQKICPDILVKGADYRFDNVAGRESAGRVELVPLREGYSTSSLIEKIRDSVD